MLYHKYIFVGVPCLTEIGYTTNIRLFQFTNSLLLLLYLGYKYNEYSLILSHVTCCFVTHSGLLALSKQNLQKAVKKSRVVPEDNNSKHKPRKSSENKENTKRSSQRMKKVKLRINKK